MEAANPVAMQEVYNYFSKEPHYNYSARDAIDNILKEGSQFTRFVLLDALNELAKKEYLYIYSGSMPHYGWRKHFGKKTFKRKFNFNARSNN